MTQPQTTDAALVGAILSRRYRLIRKLGAGGMGEVYAAETVDGGQRMAVKVLHPEHMTDPNIHSRFLAEADACQRLIHPNIIRVHESGQAEDGTPYLAMELLEGVPLSAYTQNGGRVPLAQAAPILHGILAALAAAHAQGIVHRDLKPENVFLTRDTAGLFVVKVIDFGIAKVMDAAGGMGTRTRTGMLLGTPAYMSPEQIRSARDVDPRSDLWSAGVMFYEMLTGRVAFPAPTEYARLTQVLNSEPEPVEHVDPKLQPLAGFVQRALAKDPNRRFQSAIEMARALTAAVGGNPIGREAHPLSRLPEVPSLLGPSLPSAMKQSGPLDIPRTARATDVRAPDGSQGDTLASGVSEVREKVQAQVVMAQPISVGGTLPSEGLPMLEAAKSGVPRLGVRRSVVTILVAIGIFLGFMLGFVVSRWL